MDFNPPHELSEPLRQIDRFIDQEIRPLQAQDDNERFFVASIMCRSSAVAAAERP